MSSSGKKKSRWSWRRFASRHWRVCLALAFGFFLSLANYWVDNCPNSLIDDTGNLIFTEYLTDRYAHSEDIDSVLYVNVAYDKELVSLYDDFGDTLGTASVTNRATLLRFLQVAEEAGYRYMVLDVRFEPGMYTPADSALWTLMGRLPRFAYSAHSQSGDAAANLAGHNAAFADYSATMTTGFTRWQFFRSEGESIPLKMAGELNGVEINNHGLWYSDRGHICRNALFIPLPSDLLLSEYPDGRVRYPNLGSQILRFKSEEEIAEMMHDKIVIIGDFGADTHETYIGPVPGPVLIYESYRQLAAGHHRLNPLFYLLIFAFFSLMSWCVLRPGSLLGRIKWLEKHPILRFIISFISWNVTLKMLNIVCYLTLAENFITLIPSLFLTIADFLTVQPSKKQPSK